MDVYSVKSQKRHKYRKVLLNDPEINECVFIRGSAQSFGSVWTDGLSVLPRVEAGWLVWDLCVFPVNSVSVPNQTNQTRRGSVFHRVCFGEKRRPGSGSL